MFFAFCAFIFFTPQSTSKYAHELSYANTANTQVVCFKWDVKHVLRAVRKEPNVFELWRTPHKACQRWEGLHLDGRSAEIDVGLVSAAVPDAHKVPLANQVARGRGRDLVSDDGFCSNVFQNLRRTRRAAARVGIFAWLLGRLLLRLSSPGFAVCSGSTRAFPPL